MGGIAGRYHGQGIMIVAALPLVAGNASLVNNEMFSAMVVGAALLLSLRALTRPHFSTVGAVTLGLVWGLAMLCKFTALIPLLAVSVTFIQRGSLGQ
ncbi:MAG: hypothetical protein HC898_00775 [Phycisphaerales bacterium]|nr:hypothetical protein [Phycisphaerales bacterium]